MSGSARVNQSWSGSIHAVSPETDRDRASGKIAGFGCGLNHRLVGEFRALEPLALDRFWGIMSEGIRPAEATSLPPDWAWSGGGAFPVLSRVAVGRYLQIGCRPGYRMPSTEARISRASTSCSRRDGSTLESSADRGNHA